MVVLVWSLMGQDAGQPLPEIITRKNAELKTGGEAWWGGGTPLGARVESEAISNGGTLPAVFSPLENQKQALDPNTCVWDGFESILTGVQGDIPPHVLVLGGNPDRPYYALVCRCDTELVLGRTCTDRWRPNAENAPRSEHWRMAYSFAGGASATAASVVSSRNVNVSWR